MLRVPAKRLGSSCHRDVREPDAIPAAIGQIVQSHMNLDDFLP